MAVGPGASVPSAYTYLCLIASQITRLQIAHCTCSFSVRPVMLEFLRYPTKDLCTARYEHKFSKFETFQKPRKIQFLGRSWAKIGLRKTQPNVCSKRRDSESWTDIDRQNQRLRHEIWTGRARLGAPTQPLVSDYKMTGDRWRAPARRLIQTHLGAAV